MTNLRRVYLAGPEAFFPAQDHADIVAIKKQLLRERGLEGVDPLDTELSFADQESKQAQGHRIYLANRELMDSCDAIIANLTPFRGISADAGTVFEVGYMIAQGKPAAGFTMDHRDYRERAGSTDQDSEGHTIEDFGLRDNLMIECGLSESGGSLFVAEQKGCHHYFSTAVFRQCVQAIARKLASD